MNYNIDTDLEKFLQETCLFFQPWWLETVSPRHWGYAVAKRGDDICAVLPYVYKKRLRKYLLLEMPLLTPYLGPWLKMPNKKYIAKGVEEEKKILYELIAKLPSYASFLHYFHYSISNWLPFYWKNFNQSTVYTYILDNIIDHDKIFANFSHAKRKNIKRAMQLVEVRCDLPSQDFYSHLSYTLSQKGKRVQYSFDFFDRFYNACYLNNSGKVFYAIDEKKKIHSVIFIVWDQKSAYYLISSIDPEFTNSGSVSLLVFEAIKYCSSKTLKFDFCGSMNETIERSSREFGGKQTPYFCITKVDSNLVKIYRAIRKYI